MTDERPDRAYVLDALKCAQVCAILTLGGTREVAAHYVGCHPATIRRHALRNAVFARELRQAQAQHEIGYLQCILAASKKEQYWRAASWALERKYPRRYVQRKPRVVTADEIHRVLAEFASIVADEVPDLEHRRRILARVRQLIRAEP